MEVRKYPAADLENNKMLFYAIGLVVSLIFVIIAFEWKFYDRGDIANLGAVEASFDEILDIPPTEQPPPPPPSEVKLTNIVEVEDLEEIEEEIEITIDVEMTEDMVTEQVEQVDVSMEVEEEVADEIFTIVENYPEPVGGMNAFYEYVYANIKYPQTALRAGIQGKVFLQFVVAKDGTIKDLVVVKGIGAGCDEEAVRVFKNAPKWTPGRQRGQPVAVRMIVPIQFKIMG